MSSRYYLYRSVSLVAGAAAQRKKRILFGFALIGLYTFVIVDYLSPWVAEKTYWTRLDRFHFNEASRLSIKLDSYSRTPLSPGLQWCSSNPFLSAYDRKTVFYMEHLWHEWFETQLQNVYDILTKFALSNKTAEELIVDMIYPQSTHLPCPQGLARYGKNIGTGKFLCGLSELERSSDCIVYSLGSNNNFDFEESVSRRTSCHVHTYDCTSSPPEKPLERVTFHRVCMGEKTNLQQYMYPNAGTVEKFQNRTMVFKRFSQIMKANKHQQVHVLKMDIEGAEYAVFADLFNSAREFALPYQISFESHWWARDLYHATLHQQMFSQLWKHGYRVLQHEVNPGDPACVEWTLMRVFCKPTNDARP